MDDYCVEIGNTGRETGSSFCEEGFAFFIHSIVLFWWEKSGIWHWPF